MFQRLGLAALALFMLAGAAPGDPAALFGARESIEQISLSPDGERIAYIAPRTGQGNALYTVDLAGGQPSVAVVADGAPQRLNRCGWVSDARLVCTIFGLVEHSGEIMPVTRLVAVDADGGDLKLLSERDSFYARGVALYGGGIVDWLPEEDGAVLMGRLYIPEQRENTRLEQSEEGYGVDRVDTRTLQRRNVERPRRNGAEYISDGHGRVRIMGIQPDAGATGYSGSSVNYFYRKKGSDEWHPLGSYDVMTREGYNPLAVDRDLDALYALKKRDGRLALYRVALDGSMREELVFAHPQVDVDNVVWIGRRGRVVGASFATEKRQAVYFDPEIDALATALSKALPDLPQIHPVGSSIDEGKLLLWAGSDVDPGRYYIFDKAARKLDEIMLARPKLEGVPLASVKPVSFRASDGTGVPGYLTLPPGSTGKNLPAIVMPHGGPEARDEWGFDWLAQYYANRGYAVLQPNFRGSTGYGDAWFQNNGYQSWRSAIGDVTDAGRWLVAEGIADPDKLAIVGWSYGGYAALQSGVVAPDLFKAIVAIAPVADLKLAIEESRYWSSFALERERIGSGPHLTEGSPAQNAPAITAPVLMFHGDMDRNVDIAQARLMADKLTDAGKAHELIVYPGLDHYLEDSAARADMLRRSDAFLRASMGM